MEEEEGALSESEDAPSLEENPGEVQQEEQSESESNEEDDGEHEPYVNYERFHQVNTQKNQLTTELATVRQEAEQLRAATQDFEDYKDLIAQVKEMGGMSALQQVMAETSQQQESATKQQRESEIQKEIDDLVEAGDISPALGPRIAELLKMKDRLEPVAQNLEARQYEQQVNSNIAELKSKYPEMDERLVRLEIDTGGDAADAAKYSHERHAANEAAIISRYNTKKQESTASIPPTPGGDGGGPQARVSKIPDPVKDPDAFDKYMEEGKSRNWK